MVGSSTESLPRKQSMVRHRTGLRLLLGGILLFLASDLRSHPAHAKPVNYPYVVGFERFHSSLDDDEYLAQGGLILLNELNCVACHAAPEAFSETLSGVSGTRLDGVSGRLEAVDLELMIRNPRFLKQDTIMPSLFSGPDRDLEEVEALRHFLSSLPEEIPKYPEGDIEAGRLLYHRIGCAACHAPEVGYRPAGIPDNAEIELAGLPSVPMNLADRYGLDALTHFLLFPNEHRPSGRMPDFHLSQKEAIDLSAYLKAGPDLELPKNVSEALGAATTEIDPELVRKGKALFLEKNCHACHALPEEGIAQAAPMSLSLRELSRTEDKGCLSERPPGGKVPFYGLDLVQKRSIRAALERLSSFENWDSEKEIDWRMKRLNCYACHERAGVGGPETAREVYFGFGSEEGIALGRAGHLPPALDVVGAKLKPEWLDMVLLHPEKAVMRPYLAARMPKYLEKESQSLLAQLKEHDQLPDWELVEAGRGEESPNGKELFSGARENCEACHGAGETQPIQYPGMNLGHSSRRLVPEYFDLFLRRKYSAHPPRVEGMNRSERKLTQEDTDALWEWLRSVAVGE